VTTQQAPLIDGSGILLLSCYELGHQPLGVALPIGLLEAAGYRSVAQDLAVDRLDADLTTKAKFVGICVPMHTALRLGVRVAERIREINPDCHICFFGLYASLNAETLLDSVADSVIGGEYENALVELVSALASGSQAPVEGVSRKGRIVGPVLQRISFARPSRARLPTLDQYAKLVVDREERTVGYVEASRGCKHHCLHCPIPPVYEGKFFLVPPETVLEDIAQQVEAGARHITFGDPDFLNGPNHSRRIVRSMHERFPSLTFDFTAKIEHLLKHRDLLPAFAECGALFVISAVESFSDVVLKHLAKGHTRADALEAFKVVREAGIVLRPSLVAFTPWTTLDEYIELFDIVGHEGLIDAVDPIQYAIRLLVPPGSLLERDPAIAPYLGKLDAPSFTYRWTHPDPRMDRLYRDANRVVGDAAEQEEDAAVTFAHLRELAQAAREGREPKPVAISPDPNRTRPPRLTEPWFCCAEPTEGQFGRAV
jgi:radical SAM superfamily enzyme YgiQ (UPF0313 family)